MEPDGPPSTRSPGALRLAPDDVRPGRADHDADRARRRRSADADQALVAVLLKNGLLTAEQVQKAAALRPASTTATSARRSSSST